MTMSRTAKLASAGALVAAAIAAVGLALPGYAAGPGQPGTGASTGCVMGPDGGSRNQMGPGGNGRGGERGPAANLPPSGTLTEQQAADLAAMAEEEKLAHDVYLVLAEQTGDRRFTMIAGAESRHLAAVRTLLARYDLADPTAGLAAGDFSTPATARLYATFIADAGRSLEAAVEVGRTIERTDIADLAAAREGVTAPDVRTVYDRLSNASQHHLAAFGG